MVNQLPKNGYGFIYKYTSPSGKSYIGQTITSLYNRAGGKNGKAYRKCPLFYKAIVKYGFKNFEVEILAELPKSQLNNAEKKYIELFNTMLPNGYNVLTGGNQYGTKMVYQYNSSTGEYIASYDAILIAANLIGCEPQAISDCIHGRALTAGGYCWSLQQLKKYPIHEREDSLKISNNPKEIRMYSLDGTFLQAFNSIGEAAEKTNSERSAIKKCCRNELRQHNGYKWECDEILQEKKYNNTARSIAQIDKDTGDIIATFPSISAAAKAFNKNGTSLFRRALNDNHYSAYGYKWRYI